MPERMQELWEKAPFGGPQLTVLDTGTIFNDLVYQLRHDREEGTLLCASRQGATRLFAAEHIRAEVVRRAPSQERRGISAAALVELFERRYLPEIRFVEIAPALSDSRVGAVAAEDPDDVPTAQLALLLAPCQVYSEDPDLTEAGFGEAGTWLTVTQSAERVQQIDRGAIAAFLLCRWAWSKARAWARRSASETRPVEVLTGVALGVTVLSLMPPSGHSALGKAIDVGERVLTGAGEVGATGALALLGERARQGGYLAQTLVMPEGPLSLEQQLARRLAVIRRAEVAELAHSLMADPLKVGRVLESRPCFTQDCGGWQLGRRYERC